MHYPGPRENAPHSFETPGFIRVGTGKKDHHRRETMVHKRLPIVIVLSIFILSCATAGKRIDVEAVKQNIIIGKSTKEDVMRVCGEPIDTEYDAKNEIEIWRYAYMDKSITGAGVFTSLVGVGSEWKSETTMVDIHFKKNVVCDIKCQTSSKTKMHYQ
jgi:hypothetical protein